MYPLKWHNQNIKNRNQQNKLTFLMNIYLYYVIIYYNVSLVHSTISDRFVITRLLQLNNLYKIMHACILVTTFFPPWQATSSNVFLNLSYLSTNSCLSLYLATQKTSSPKNENDVIKTIISSIGHNIYFEGKLQIAISDRIRQITFSSKRRIFAAVNEFLLCEIQFILHKAE